MKVKFKVALEFDPDRINDALGNTSKVPAKDALLELLGAILSEYGSVDSYGDPSRYHPHLEDHVYFEIIED